MKTSRKTLFLYLLTTAFIGSLHADPDNPNIDMPGFLKVAGEAAKHRGSRRVSEEEFMRLSQLPGTVVLDARSRAKYDLLHVKGALNLDFSDIDIASLQKALPDKNVTILIYCNNNFRGAPVAMPAKFATASLNLSTYVALYNYGYTNVYELAPFIDVQATKLPLVSAVPRPLTR